MNDLKQQEPDIQIFYPLLINSSSNAAILYGYLKTCCLDQHREEGHYVFNLKRFDVKWATGLSFGQQIDAEQQLDGADLITANRIPGDWVEYWVYPENEDRLRRFVYSKRANWK